LGYSGRSAQKRRSFAFGNVLKVNSMVVSTLFVRCNTFIACSLLLVLAGCSSTGGRDVASATPLACDDSLKSTFKPDALTQVVAVRQFKAGEEVRLANSAGPHAKAEADMCMVKLLVGPGNPGPQSAPSTSPGIGIEVWLPARDKWGGMIRAFGSGGWAGGYYADATRIGQTGSANQIQLAAVHKGYAVSATDHGHGGTVSGRNASFALNPDGSTNTTLWRDFAERSMYEQAVKTQALVRAYYGKAHTFAYFDGFSTGGRQGYKLAQKYPELYNGILAGAPAFNWTRFITAELYPQIVMQRDLGAGLPNAKTYAVSALSLRSCGGAQASLGFLLDPLACKYDPARDAAALCAGVQGDGVQGTSRESTCLNLREAQVYNKIWYGMTHDGSAPTPAQDNGGTGALAANAGQMWWGLTRGADLTALADEKVPFPIATQLTALTLGKPSIAQKGMLTNGTGQADDGWKAMSYADLVQTFERGLQRQADFSDINTDSVDLSRLRDRGAKVLSYHGLSDQLIMPQGSLNYFDRLTQNMGGVDKVQTFNRLFMIPGLGHSGAFNLSASVGLDGKITPFAAVPLPQPATGRDEMFNALRQWVEKGVAPERIDLSAASGTLSMPICAYPKRSLLTATDTRAASSYTCQ
jgi:pimeloyl-ACP methyl ester carboxylesterase